METCTSEVASALAAGESDLVNAALSEVLQRSPKSESWVLSSGSTLPESVDTRTSQSLFEFLKSHRGRISVSAARYARRLLPEHLRRLPRAR